MKKPRLNENFICRIWEDQNNYSDLQTVENEPVEINDYGKKNTDAGPDYKDAKIKIGDIIYTGSIEIHRTLKDWYLHNHKGDNKYNDVILHIVFYENEFDEDILFPKVKKARSIPTVILSHFLSRSIHDIWKEIINNPSATFKLPCYSLNNNVSALIKSEWLDKLSFERLNYKSERISSRLEMVSDDIRKRRYWDIIFFELICEVLGYSKNKDQFLKLSCKIDLKKVSVLKLNQIQTDAMMFGLSGFLTDLRFKNEYCDELRYEWNRLKASLKSESMIKSEWNFFRLRPSNFPTQRIAYASGILNEIINNNFFRDIIHIFEYSDNIKKDIIRRFSDVPVSDYWKNHFRFGKESKAEIKPIGTERISDIISNLLLPFIYIYSKKFDKINLELRVISFYKDKKQKKETNEVTRVMESQLDFKAKTMADSQGLIQLHNFYCMKGKCNECEIGRNIFNYEMVNEPLKIILY